METKIRNLHTREIIRCAKRQGITLTRGGVGKVSLQERKLCVISVINNEVFGQPHSSYGNAKENIAKYFGLPVNNIYALEEGFEGWYSLHSENPYYKVGQNVARLAGLA